MFQHFFQPSKEDMEAQGVKEQRLVEQIDETTKVEYWRMKIPMMTERDNLLLIHHHEIGDDKFTVMKTIERDDTPEVPGIIRTFMFTRGLFHVNEAEGALDYTEVSFFNMNGMFPTRLMNMMVASETKASFEHMYKTLTKDKK